MPSPLPRRAFVASLAAAAAVRVTAAPVTARPTFKISLTQGALQRTILAGELDTLEFPRIARKQFGLAAVEYGSRFFKDGAKDVDFIADLAERARDEGVTNLLVRCDGLGSLGDPDDKARTQAVENHFPWVEAARRLGCQAIRVHLGGRGTPAEQRPIAAEGLARLCEFAAQAEISVLAETDAAAPHDAAWLIDVIRATGAANVGTLPDFDSGQAGDPYDRVARLMPLARALAATSRDFDTRGQEVHVDFRRMLGIVTAAGYRGWVGIAYVGRELSESDGILATKRLLEHVRAGME